MELGVQEARIFSIAIVIVYMMPNCLVHLFVYMHGARNIIDHLLTLSLYSVQQQQTDW